MATRIFGNVIATSATKGGTPTARIGLYAGKDKETGEYRDGPVIEVIGKPLADLKVGQKAQVTVGAISDRIYDRNEGGQGVGLNAVAMKAEVVEGDAKHDPIVIQGNLVADPEGSDFRVGVHDTDKEDKDVTTFYGVRTVKIDTSDLKKGSFVELSGQLTVSIGKNGDRAFRNLTAFSMKKIEKKEKSEATA